MRIFALLPLLLVLSCAAKPPPPAKEPPQPPWSGTWTRLDGLAVPKEKKLVLAQSCTRSAEYWTIEQKGNSILLDYHESTTASGVLWAVETKKIEKARGERRKSFVRLDGQTGAEEVSSPHADTPVHRSRKFPVTYELEWDPKTDHLFGTRNGSPVRFVRADIAPVTTQCQKVQ